MWIPPGEYLTNSLVGPGNSNTAGPAERPSPAVTTPRHSLKRLPCVRS